VIAHYQGTDSAMDQACPLQIEKLGILGMVNLMFPMSFLFSTLVGGCIGGVLRLFKLRRKERAEWYWLVSEGMLVGLVFVAALSAGIGSVTGTLSPAVVGSEVGAFAIAALSGFVGTAALDYFTKNLFKTDSPR
jgi:lipopolysaccharide export LptBFGC system permease protein LptF